MSASIRQEDKGAERRGARQAHNPALPDIDYDALHEPVEFSFSVDRRSFVQIVGAGVLVSAVAGPTLAQRSGHGRGGNQSGPPPAALSARIHFGDDGTITLLTGKVDAGQGSRVQLAQAAAEELRVSFDRVRVQMCDTAITPNDGHTAGSRTTPANVPAVRQAAAAIRELIVSQAAEIWNVAANDVEARDGRITQKGSNRSLSYAEVVRDEAFAKKLSQPAPTEIKLTPVAAWKTLGTDAKPPTARDKVLGRHSYPSDLKRPGMVYGRVLRAPKYRGTLVSADLAPAKSMDGVIAVQDGTFVGVAARTAFTAEKAIEAIAKTALWKDEPLPTSDELYEFLREHAQGGVPANPFASDIATAAKSLKATYTTAYIQHVPLEPRTAIAEWRAGPSSAPNASPAPTDPQLTIWTATQNPFGVRSEVARAFRLPEDSVRIIVPDFGAGYGGKHTGECAVEAARIAKAAGKPVMLRWTREEEFTWAYFRPAAVIDLEASLDDTGKLTSWWHVNINSGGSSIDSPYDVANKESRYVDSRPPLRHGAYRALASTANSFARECFMDELAHAAEADPLAFRIKNLQDTRLRAVLEDAAARFKWVERVKQKQPGRGVGLACSLDKGSYVACCVEVEVDAASKAIKVLHVCQSFDCGPVMNPNNLRSQMEGAIIQGLGPALREEMKFADGQITNASFARYRVPHFKDVPTIEVHAIDRRDAEPAGAGETVMIAIAPAIGNAVFAATGERIRSMPLKPASSGDS